jgi:hypothetical protein
VGSTVIGSLRSSKHAAGFRSRSPPVHALLLVHGLLGALLLCVVSCCAWFPAVLALLLYGAFFIAVSFIWEIKTRFELVFCVPKGCSQKLNSGLSGSAWKFSETHV